ncbi:hypothetical protein CDIK_1550 [Cucumispora dikerogammari]|nr:hypothetical protein CDIK_1550 [Cucumispora dikerogammari]
MLSLFKIVNNIKYVENMTNTPTSRVNTLISHNVTSQASFSPNDYYHERPIKKLDPAILSFFENLGKNTQTKQTHASSINVDVENVCDETQEKVSIDSIKKKEVYSNSIKKQTIAADQDSTKSQHLSINNTICQKNTSDKHGLQENVDEKSESKRFNI